LVFSSAIHGGSAFVWYMKKNQSAIALIKQDHRAVEKLYREYRAAEGNEEERDTLIEEICKSLEMHAKMEEKHFYPALQKETNAHGDMLLVEAYAEHMGMKALVKTVKNLPEGMARDASLSALMGVVKHHVREEEQEILPEAEKTLGRERLEELGGKMASMSPSEKKKKEEMVAA
jgi:hemerythrin-like domain-containing protein